MSWTHEPNLRRAHTPPAAIYRDTAAFAAQRDLVLARAWHPVELPQGPHQVVPANPLDGLVGLPAVITQDKAGTVRALSNVCTHRGALLVPAACKTRSLRCPYHGRSFALDGQLRAAPGFDEALDFPSPSDHLPQLDIGQLGPIGLIAHNPFADIDAYLAPIHARCGHLPWDALTPDPTGERVYEMDAHWMLYVDNYLEGFHIPYVHPGLKAALDSSAYDVELHPWGTLQVGLAANPDEAFAPAPDGHPDAGKAIAAYYWWLFPNLMVNLYPWGVSLNIVVPRGPTQSAVAYHRYVWDAARLGQGAGGDLDSVEQEDQFVVGLCGQGLRSQLYDRGRYSPEHEAGVHHFHGLLHRLLTP